MKRPAGFQEGSRKTNLGPGVYTLVVGQGKKELRKRNHHFRNIGIEKGFPLSYDLAGRGIVQSGILLRKVNYPPARTEKRRRDCDERHTGKNDGGENRESPLIAELDGGRRKEKAPRFIWGGRLKAKSAKGHTKAIGWGGQETGREIRDAGKANKKLGKNDDLRKFATVQKGQELPSADVRSNLEGRVKKKR